MNDTKQTSYTPGPWTYEFDEEDRDSYYIRGDDLSIGVVWIDNGETDSPLDAEANARLIAAAPDLLEALQALVPDHDYGHDDPDICPTCVRYRKARAAIAKATGESA